MFKKIAIALFIASMMLSGCKSKEQINVPQQPTTTNTIQLIEFNQEHYIWESFLFPTNRTTGR